MQETFQCFRNHLYNTISPNHGYRSYTIGHWLDSIIIPKNCKIFEFSKNFFANLLSIKNATSPLSTRFVLYVWLREIARQFFYTNDICWCSYFDNFRVFENTVFKRFQDRCLSIFEFFWDMGKPPFNDFKSCQKKKITESMRKKTIHTFHSKLEKFHGTRLLWIDRQPIL